ncbi:hypothetical protein PTSG_11169 [Salpingoeca rosetta]|uniref:Uncharacterized protein n=1 Tax=Salpingoeca rosetta (strain ATCC 50818 / BSB-021) TaxID=946362 RepID=F2USM2_SALR5|nr:uncharacterized protein PTSG_11169 [Salpingoeca rosetta]EGD81131.1 hypothetical protein PTSG_11169 [Salpingoeca rosetta]|eukprot:XP_004987816.1 hypothetical protein PTSG_11169 [Salpingoeca rosetta]
MSGSDRDEEDSGADPTAGGNGVALPLLRGEQGQEWYSERIQEQLDINQTLLENMVQRVQRGAFTDILTAAKVAEQHISMLASLSDDIKLQCLEADAAGNHSEHTVQAAESGRQQQQQQQPQQPQQQPQDQPFQPFQQQQPRKRRVVPRQVTPSDGAQSSTHAAFDVAIQPGPPQP